MAHKNTTNDDHRRYYPIVIGDILLHSERKTTPIQVIIQSLIKIPSPLINENSNSPRLLPNSFESTNNQTRIACDSKNPTIGKSTRKQTLSAKEFMRIYQAGWTLLKGLKSKIIKMDDIESKISTGNKNSNNELTRF